MAPRKKLRKISRRVRKRVSKKKLLGAVVIIAAITFISILANYFIVKAQIKPIYAMAVLVFIGGFFAVLIEMRGTLGKRVSRVKSRIRKRRKK